MQACHGDVASAVQGWIAGLYGETFLIALAAPETGSDQNAFGSIA